MTDKELIQQVCGGSKEALGAIIERYYEDIFRFCLYMVGDENSAYDITQDTFLKFIKYRASYCHKNLKGYLLTIARNLCYSYFVRREAVEMSQGEATEQISAKVNLLERKEINIYLGGLLGELSWEIREVIILRIYQELKFKDIAKIMGCNVSTAKSRFRLGIEQLRRKMEDENGKI